MISFGVGTDGTLPVSSTSECLTKKKTFSFIYIPDVPEQSVTNFNGEGVNNHPLKNVV
jgi:hypothetical protein